MSGEALMPARSLPVKRRYDSHAQGRGNAFDVQRLEFPLTDSFDDSFSKSGKRRRQFGFAEDPDLPDLPMFVYQCFSNPIPGTNSGVGPFGI
jgi:hypothetical protein